MSSSTIVRIGPFSQQIHRRTVVVCALFFAGAVLLAGAGLALGDYTLSPGGVIAALRGEGSARDHLVVNVIRLPRIVLGVVVGVCLAVAGAVVQTTARNSLASPDLLGVSAGAGAGAVAAIVLGGTNAAGVAALDVIGTPIAALIGGTLAAALVGLLLGFTGTTGLSPLLAGVGVSALFGGLTSWMLTAASIDDAARANAWLAGSLGGRGWAEVAAVTVAAVAALVPLVVLSSRLPALELGSSLATSLGYRVPASVAMLLLLAVVLTSVPVAAAGPIGFIALVAPHLARLACRTPRPPLVASAVAGAALLLASDLVARLALAPLLLPTGAVTAVVGAPFLIWLLVRSRRDLTQ